MPISFRLKHAARQMYETGKTLRKQKIELFSQS